MVALAVEAREVMQGLARLGLLLASRIDAVPRENDPCLCGELECFFGGALHRELQDARSIRVEPQLRDRLASDGFVQLEFGSRDIDRSERRQGVELEPLRRMLRVERALLTREQFTNRSSSLKDFLDVGTIDTRLQRP